jgi:hypothetical protein
MMRHKRYGQGKNVFVHNASKLHEMPRNVRAYIGDYMEKPPTQKEMVELKKMGFISGCELSGDIPNGPADAVVHMFPAELSPKVGSHVDEYGTPKGLGHLQVRARAKFLDERGKEIYHSVYFYKRR